MNKIFIGILLLALLSVVVLAEEAAPAVATPPLQSQPQVIQNVVAAVNSTLTNSKSPKVTKIKFLRNILKNLKDLGLIKRSSEKERYNQKDASILLRKVIMISKHLSQLKKEGKTEEFNKYIADLKKSKNFETSVRTVRMILRKFIRKQIRKLAQKIRDTSLRATQKKIRRSLPPRTPSWYRRPAVLRSRPTIRPIRRSLPVRRLPIRRFPVRRTLVKRPVRRYPMRRQIRRYPIRRPIKRYPIRRYPVRRFPVRRYPIRRQRRFPARRQIRRYPIRRPVRRYPIRRFPIKRYPIRRPIRRFPVRRPVKRFPIRRFPVRSFPIKRPIRKVPRPVVNSKPLFTVDTTLVKNILKSMQ